MKYNQSSLVFFVLFLIFLFISVLSSSIQTFADSQSSAFIMWLVGTPLLLHVVTLIPLVLALIMQKKK